MPHAGENSMRKIFAALFLCLCCSFAAADTLYTTRTAFDAVTTAATTATFNNGVSSSGYHWYPGGATVDGIHFADNYTGVYQEGGTASGGAYSLDGTADMIAYVSALPATVTLPTAVTALGLDLGGTLAGTYRISLSNGQVYELALNPGGATFFGVTSSAPITSFQIGYVGWSGRDTTALFDNVTYGTAVPEPGSLLLLGSGLAGLLSTMRKKLRK
jgi:hypothetical protein